MELAFYAADVVLPPLGFSRGKMRHKIQFLLEKLFLKEKTKCSAVTYVFCSDAFLLNINREFLMHDDYTDIITFDLSDPGQPVAGEIYISLDRVRENATQLKLLLKDEVLRVMIHGALHLCGYKDKTKADKLRMSTREDYYLNLLKQTK